MAETKEEKAIRETLEAEAKAFTDAEELKAKEAAAEADKSSEPSAELAELAATPSHLQEVSLNDESASVLTNTHTIFHAKGSTEFVNGVANVNAEVAAHLKESGQVK